MLAENALESQVVFGVNIACHSFYVFFV
jgi:hypothetical protein